MPFTHDTELFRAIFNSTFQFIGLMQPDGTLLEANQTALDFGGLRAADVVGRPFWECHWWTIAPATQAQLRTAIARAAQGEFVRYEVDVLGAEGRVVTIDFSIKPIFDAAGKVMLLIPEGRNITDRKQAERERDRIFELSPDLLAVAGLDGYFKRLNPAWEQTMGYYQEELLALPYLDLVHPDDLPAAQREVARLAQGVPTTLFEIRCRHKDGSYRWLAWNVDPLPEEGRLYCTARDVTLQKQAEQVLRESEALLASVLNSSLDGIAAFQSLRDATGQIIDFVWILINPKAEEILKRPAADLLGKRLLKTMPAHAENGLFDAYKRVVETGQPRNQEFRYDGDGLHHWFQHTAVKLDDGFAVTFRDITAQKATEEMRLALSAGQMGTWDLTLATGEVNRSQSTDQIFGYRSDGSIRTVEDYVSRVFPDDVASVRDAIAFSIEMRAEHYIEYRVVWPDGSIHWVASRGNVLLDEQGQPMRLVGALTEITERKQVEEALRASEAQLQHSLAELQTIYATAPVGLCFVDTQLRFVKINQALAEMNGVPIEATIGQTLREVLPTIADVIEPYYYQVMATGEPVVNLEVRGEPAWMPGFKRATLASFYPVYDVEDTLLGINVVIQDITERKQAEEALRESEERFRVALKNAPILVYNADQQLRYTWIYNPPHGFTVAQVTGKRDDELLPAADVAELVAFKQHVLDTCVGHRREIRMRFGDQAHVYDVTAEPLCDEQGQVVGLTVAALEITGLKQAEAAMREAKEAAEAASRMKSVFLANMSHEIRTPLTSMIGYASLLARRLEGKERSQAQRIEEGGKRLLETLNALLMLAKLEAGGVEVQFDDLHMAAEVGEIVRLYRQQAEAKNLMLTFNLKPAAVTARAHLDRGALNSILQNLISNAIKFTHRGGITVTVDLDETRMQTAATQAIPAPAGWITVHVEDTGVGIAPDFLPHIFDAFRQESTGLSRSYDGAGLGLAITKQLVEKMHGTIGVVSEKDHGSRFTVRFPQVVTELLPEVVATAPEVTAAQDTTTHPRCHILLVEDNEDTQKLIEALLEDRCELTIVGDALAAQAAARQMLETMGQPFDAILMDIHLGRGPNGIDALAALRTLPAYRAVPIAALTAYALPGDRERFLEVGFDAYLRKPFTADELLEFTAQLLQI